MSTEELIAAAEGLVKELQGRINGGGMDLQEAEAKILEMVNWIGDVWLCSTEISSATSVLLTTARSKLPDRVNPCYRFWHWHPSGTSGTNRRHVTASGRCSGYVAPERDERDEAGRAGPCRPLRPATRIILPQRFENLLAIALLKWVHQQGTPRAATWSCATSATWTAGKSTSWSPSGACLFCW